MEENGKEWSQSTQRFLNAPKSSRINLLPKNGPPLTFRFFDAERLWGAHRLRLCIPPETRIACYAKIFILFLHKKDIQKANKPTLLFFFYVGLYVDSQRVFHRLSATAVSFYAQFPTVCDFLLTRIIMHVKINKNRADRRWKPLRRIRKTKQECNEHGQTKDRKTGKKRDVPHRQ